MTPGARLAAAADILSDILRRRSAADRTIADWGRAHRFAGAKDRAAIAERVYAVLRRLNECAFRMESEAPRALVLGSLSVIDGRSVEEIEALCTDGPHAPGPLDAEERRALATMRAPAQDEPWIPLNYPRWLHAELAAAFGVELAVEMAALSGRAPLDLRVNGLKARRGDALRELEDEGLEPEPCTHAAMGIRLPGAARRA